MRELYLGDLRKVPAIWIPQYLVYLCIFILKINIYMKHILIFLCTVAVNALFAQEGFGVGMQIGLNYAKIRGTSEVVTGSNATPETFNPNSGLQGGLLLRWGFTDRFGLRLEVNYAQRGMKYIYEGVGIQPFKSESGTTILTTGQLKYNLNLSNGYMELPLTAYIQVTNHWELHAGGYVAYLASSKSDGVLTLKGAKTLSGTSVPDYDGAIDYNYLSAADDKADVTNNKILFTEGIHIVKNPTSLGAYYARGTANGYLWNRWDYGVSAGVSYRMRSGLTAMARVNYGMTDVTNNAVHSLQSSLDANRKYILRDTKDNNVSAQISFIFGN